MVLFPHVFCHFCRCCVYFNTEFLQTCEMLIIFALRFSLALSAYVHPKSLFTPPFFVVLALSESACSEIS